MRPTLERDSNGRITLSKERKRNGRVNKRMLSMGLAIAVIAIAATGIQVALAAGGQVQHNYQQNLGEDGYYEENNNNDFPDYEFPGDADQNRTGVEDPGLD